MSREILYRGKAINRDNGYFRSNYKNGDWVYGLVTRLYDERFERLPAEMTDINGISAIEVDYKTIGQYTGLTDKSGTRIFDGDIVKDEQSGYEYLIKWFTEYACYGLANKSGHMEFSADKLEMFLNDLVVIGNIYDKENWQW